MSTKASYTVSSCCTHTPIRRSSYVLEKSFRIGDNGDDGVCFWNFERQLSSCYLGLYSEQCHFVMCVDLFVLFSYFLVPCMAQNCMTLDVEEANSKSQYPRMYVSDSSLFSRLTDVVRVIMDPSKPIYRGYRNVRATLKGQNRMLTFPRSEGSSESSSLTIKG